MLDMPPAREAFVGFLLLAVEKFLEEAGAKQCREQHGQGNYEE